MFTPSSPCSTAPRVSMNSLRQQWPMVNLRSALPITATCMECSTSIVNVRSRESSPSSVPRRTWRTSRATSALRGAAASTTLAAIPSREASSITTSPCLQKTPPDIATSSNYQVWRFSRGTTTSLASTGNCSRSTAKVSLLPRAAWVGMCCSRSCVETTKVL